VIAAPAVLLLAVLAADAAELPAIAAGDQVVVTKVDGGTLVGTVVSVAPDEIVLDAGGKPVEVSRAAIASMHVYRASPEPKPPRGNGPYDQAILFDPIVLLGHQIAVGYETCLSKHASFEVGLRVTDQPVHDKYDGAVVLSGVGLILQPHIYPMGHAPRGFYVAPYVLGTSWHAQWKDAPDDHGSLAGAGATIGYSWQIHRLEVKLGLGGGYYVQNASDSHVKSFLTNTGWNLDGDLDFGFLF
jgi:hypothetical protein